MVDINRGTSGVYLPPAVSNDIWQSIQEGSQVMRMAQRTVLPGSGVTIPIITGDPEAEWTNETDEKPVRRGTLANKNMTGYTIAVITPFSNQFRRDKARLYQAMVNRLPGALAKKFDRTVYGYYPAPGSDFDTLANAPEVSIANTASQDSYDGFLAALSSVAAADGDLNGWLLSPSGEIIALGARDGNDRPLFIDNVQTQGSIGSVLQRPVFRSKSVHEPASETDDEVVGFGGDWSSAFWGQVEGVSVSISDQATINDNGTQLNLWQRNMFAVRAEIEVGFIARDVDHFVRLTGAEATP